MTNDHYAAYHALTNATNPYDTLVYSRTPPALAEAQRAYDAACERTLVELDALDEANDLLSLFCRCRQYDCIDFQRTIVAAQKRAVTVAQQAERAALATLEQVRREL